MIQKAADIGLPAVLLGKTENSDQLKISVSGELILNTKVSGLKNAWESAILITCKLPSLSAYPH